MTRVTLPDHTPLADLALLLSLRGYRLTAERFELALERRDELRGVAPDARARFYQTPYGAEWLLIAASRDNLACLGAALVHAAHSGETAELAAELARVAAETAGLGERVAP